VDQAPVIEQLKQIQSRTSSEREGYFLPAQLNDLLALRAEFPQAQLVAGGTDVGLWVTKQHRQWPQVLDLSQVDELRRVEDYPHHLAIGAAVTLETAFDALCQSRPGLHSFASRFAGLPVRNSGTLGGNIANGSPIGDSMPLLIALGAHVVLMSKGSTNVPAHREMPLENLYTGYRQNVIQSHEILAWIKVPKPANELLRVYKISKRFDDDISAVCLAIRLHLQDGRVQSASIGAGGVAATPARARQTEDFLTGQVWTEALAQEAGQVLQQEFNPMSDLRGSSRYRQALLAGLMRRFWLESQGHADIDLATLGWQDFA
jgi:xanthine dehydrogenase small subunit